MFVELQGTTLPLNLITSSGLKYRNFAKQKVGYEYCSPTLHRWQCHYGINAINRPNRFGPNCSEWFNSECGSAMLLLLSIADLCDHSFRPYVCKISVKCQHNYDFSEVVVPRKL